MEGRRTPVWALLTPLPATLFSAKRAIEQFDEFELYMHFIAFIISDRRTEHPFQGRLGGKIRQQVLLAREGGEREHPQRIKASKGSALVEQCLGTTASRSRLAQLTHASGNPKDGSSAPKCKESLERRTVKVPSVTALESCSRLPGNGVMARHLFQSLMEEFSTAGATL
eukprot:1160093-Pelagomonas_calceolata.AAC.13